MQNAEALISFKILNIGCWSILWYSPCDKIFNANGTVVDQMPYFVTDVRLVL